MDNIFITILNYLWFLIKLIGFAILLSIPAYIIIKIFKNKYNSLNKKYENQILSISIIFYFFNLIILFLIYFIPSLSGLYFEKFINYIVFFIYHIFRLALINILLTGIFLVFTLITLAVYDKFKLQNNFSLFKSLIITNIFLFVLLIIFPKLIAIIIYLIYL
jgi:hypothetical protein